MALQRAMASAWGNPHRDSGRAGARALEAAREAVARATNARREDVIVTSSLTQAIHTGLSAMVAARAGRFSPRVLASASSRTTVLHAADHFGQRTEVRVDSDGVIDVEALRGLLAEETTGVVTAELANVELGTVQPAAAVLSASHDVQVPVLLDASVGLGRTPLPDDWDALVLDGSEWGCGFDIGFVVTRSRVRLRPSWPEDADAWFPGGVSPMWAYTAAVALEEFLSSAEDERSRALEISDYLRDRLPSIPGVAILAQGATERVATIVAVSLTHIDGEAAARALLERGVAVGTGSACSSSTIEPNHVLRAMGATFDGHLRITIDHASSMDDASALVSALRGIMIDL
ncbi:cysteine desulfurase [Rarobacter faecitabidus]|uniref:Cysteine desulfurase n=1 Tax=Rarobacter faecitabidus TaxID=13243 RepID=A0A542ZVD9_RARFA|nr:cysteine desulfurase [Rarobacter faecitabidus]